MVKTSRTHHNSASSLEVAILKATTHEDCPINPNHVTDILRIVSSNRTHASLCARSLGRRVGRTRNWTVALKSLVLALRLFQSGDPYFPKEVLHSVKSKSGHNLLDLSSAVSSSSSFPRHLSAFVRSFATYLHLRLRSSTTNVNAPSSPSSVREILDRIPHWQRLLDKAVSMGMGPSVEAAARSSRLVQSSLHAVVQESFDLYKDLSDGLAILLDGFFHLEYELCVSALDACVKASRQFEDLAAFYNFCKSSGIGIESEYPSVRKIPEELIDTLHEFLKDQSSFPATASTTGRLPLSLTGSSESELGEGRLYRSYDHDRYSDPGDDNLSPTHFATMSQGTTSGEKYDDESSGESSECDRGWELALLEPGTCKSNSDGGFGFDFLEENAASSLLSYPPSNQYNPFLQDTSVGRSDDDLFGFEDATTSDAQPNFWVDFSDQGKGGSVDLFADFAHNNHGDSGAIDLFASGSFDANAPSAIISVAPSDEFSSLNCGYDYESANNVAGMSPLRQTIVPTNELAGKDVFSAAPTFNATPTYADEQEQSDPFGSTPAVDPSSYQMGSRDQQNVVQQQQQMCGCKYRTRSSPSISHRRKLLR